MNRSDLRVGVYGDVNLNLIDGSAIWVQSVVEAFSGAGCTVHVLLKAPINTPRLTDHIQQLPRTQITDPFSEKSLPNLRNAVSPFQAFQILSRLDEETPFDLVVLRGFRLIREFAQHNTFRHRMWNYLTDIPQSVADMTSDSHRAVSQIAESAEVMLCQTEEFRTFLESTVPAAAGKSLIFPPVVPATSRKEAQRPPDPRDLRLVYTGKFAPHWNTLEMTALPAKLAGRGIKAEFDVVGDKFHSDPKEPTYQLRMRAALRTMGVKWHGGVSRQDAMAIAAQAHVGMGWRDAALDSSLELSTKVLEFGSVNVPVVLNRTRVHEELLGSDYPLFANSESDVLRVLESAARSDAIWSLAAERCRKASEAFSIDRAIQRIGVYLDRLRPVPSASIGSTPLKVLVASHDLKFFTRILQHLERLSDVDLRVDEWSALASHDEKKSKELLQWADVIICEWCGPNAIWYSKHKRAGQRLIVRLHRFELNAGYGKHVDIDAVDQVVCVSPHYAKLTMEGLEWPADKVGVIPNWVDVLQLDRPKYDGARFHLGMISVGEMRKRLDVALDVLEVLRRNDPRYVLFAKTKMPWDYWWIWKRDEERAHLDAAFKRIQQSPMLQGAVVFDGFGPDVGAWLRKIGFVLSTSDDESFHLAPAEGMASGAVPVIRQWPGAETIYAEEWIHHTVEDMADAILTLSDRYAWEETAGRAQDQVRQTFDLDIVTSAWHSVLRQNLDPLDDSPRLAPVDVVRQG